MHGYTETLYGSFLACYTYSYNPYLIRKRRHNGNRFLIGCITFIISYRHGFQFSESNVFRLPNGTIQDNNDLLVSYYAIYPDGIHDATTVIPLTVLLNALTSRLDAIVRASTVSTGVNVTIEGTFLE